MLPLLVTACVGVIEGGEGDRPDDGVTSTEPQPSPIAGPQKSLPAGKLAIVLAHGLDGNIDSFDPAIVAAIQADGHVVKRTEVPGVESITVRAAALGPQIDKLLAETGATKVHIIAHSMGGLDARYLISKLGYAGKVASLTTMSTPHRGSPIADVALGLTTSSLLSQSVALDALTALFGTDSASLDRALTDLSVRQAAIFNATVLDAPGVKYFSYAGFSTPGQISNANAAAPCGALPPGPTQTALVVVQPIVANGFDRVPNDAVVSIPSATWGTFLGCVAADHLSEIKAPTPTHDSPAFFKGVVAKLAAL